MSPPLEHIGQLSSSLGQWQQRQLSWLVLYVY